MSRNSSLSPHVILKASLIAWVCAQGLQRDVQAAEAPTARIVTVARGAGPGADKAAALVGHYLHEAMGKSERYARVEVNQALGNPERERAWRSFQEAEEAAVKAREAYDRLDLDAAEASGKAAVAHYERYAAYVDDFKKVAETWLLLGAVYILRGDEREGTASLEQALGVYPGCEPDPRVFNPAMRAQFSQVAARKAARPGGALSVATTPGYAEVFVDGQFAGVSPVVLDNVGAGRHFVRLHRDGARPAGKVMQVTGRSETADSVQLRAQPKFEEWDAAVDRVVQQVDDNVDKDGHAAALSGRRALARLVNADTMLVARVRLDGERVHISAAQFDSRTGRALHRAEHVFAYDSRIATYEHEVAVMLHAHFGAEAEAEGPGAAASAAEAAASSEALAKSRVPSADAHSLLPHAGGNARCLGGAMSCRALKVGLATTALTLGVAGMALGGVEYVLAANSHRQWQNLTQTAKSQPSVRVRGQNQALTGDIFMGVGAALAVTGALTFALWHPTPSAHDVTAAPRRGAQALSDVTDAPGLSLSLLPRHAGGMVQATLIY